MPTISQFWVAEAVRLIQNCTILCNHSANLCYQCKFLISDCKIVLSHFGGGKTFTGKTNMVAKGSANSCNISLKFDIASKMSVN